MRTIKEHSLGIDPSVRPKKQRLRKMSDEKTVFFLMIRRPPRSTHRYTLFPTRRSSDLARRHGVELALAITVEIRGRERDERRAEVDRDRKSTRLNSSHIAVSRMPSS